MKNGELFFSKIIVKGFKGLANNSINLKPLSIIIGENGTGKTSILESLKYATLPGLPENYNLYFTKNKPDPEISFEIQYEGVFSLIDIDLLNTAINKHFKLTLHNPTFKYRFLPNEKYSSVIKFDNISIRNTEKYESKFSEDYYQLPSKNLWLSIIPDFFNNKNKLTSLQETIINFLNFFFTEFYNFHKNQISSGGSSSGPSPFRYTFDLDFPLRKFDGENVSLKVNIFEKTSKTAFIDPFRRIDLRSPEITDYFPSEPSLRLKSDEIISFFHYAKHPDYEKLLNEINKWASEFGLNELTSIPSPKRETLLQFKDKIFNAFIDICEAGLGVGQLIYIIVECVLAEKGMILLIDEPETHLHAKYQAKVMDLIIETLNRGVQIIVATHSEYFISRLQRRIAERVISSNEVIIIETMRDPKKGIKIIDHYLDKNGYYKNVVPEVIKFAQKEFREWNIALQRERERNA